MTLEVYFRRLHVILITQESGIFICIWNKDNFVKLITIKKEDFLEIPKHLLQNFTNSFKSPMTKKYVTISKDILTNIRICVLQIKKVTKAVLLSLDIIYDFFHIFLRQYIIHCT